MLLQISILVKYRTRTNFQYWYGPHLAARTAKRVFVLQKAGYLILTVLLFVCVLGACKAKEPDKDQPKDTQTSSVTTASAAGETQTGSAASDAATDSTSALLTTNVPDIGDITVTTSRKTEGTGSSSAASAAASKTQSGDSTASKDTSSAAQGEDDGYISSYY